MTRTFLVFMSAVFFSATTLGQTSDQGQTTLTLKRAIEIALEKNFTVKQAQNNVESAQTGVMAAYGNFLPTVDFSTSWSGGAQYFNGVALGSSNVRSFSPSLSASMTVFDGFNNTSSLSRAVSTSVATEHTLGRVRQTLINRISSDYYEVLRTEKLLKIAEETVKYNVKQLERVKETTRLGSTSIVNVYQQQAQLGIEEASLVEKRNNYDIAKANLLADIAVDVSEDYRIQDNSIPEEIDKVEFESLSGLAKNFRALTAEALDHRLDYLSAREQYNATEAEVTAARSGYLPRITARGGYGWNGRTTLDSPEKTNVIPVWDPNTSTFVPYQATTPASSYSSELSNFNTNTSYNWSLTFSLPIFSGFQTSNVVQNKLVAKKNAEETLRDTERRIQVEVKNNLLLMQAAQKTYESAVNNLQLQEQNLKINQEKYNVGAGTLLDLLLAQNNHSTALSNKINSVYQYLKAKSALELSLGRINEQ
ncbi:MAG: TolC family protein [Ignavibacteriales bacterium]|nr:TolC family protein [Ignavibacteriales bacterium]